jgi:hypothetical protein
MDSNTNLKLMFHNAQHNYNIFILMSDTIFKPTQNYKFLLFTNENITDALQCCIAVKFTTSEWYS